MTKDELRSHRKAVREVRQLREQLRTLETAMLDPRAPNLAAAPRGSGPSNPVERAILRVEALRGRYADKLAALLAQQELIEQAIERLDPCERMVIREYYIAGRSWERVCETMHYTERHTHRIHGRALQKLQDVSQCQF